MQLIAHVTSYECGTAVVIFLVGVVVGQCVSLIGSWIKARRC